ncbi:MAG: acyl-CoA dehydrogenase family protein [Armatimonadetes bacterium]|nr:acyl-CoA dehydrogenase family protein [Armatimonadota bacterium]MDW8154608.1 acyl-CoA dehydrogenase family protein [Armatimonadota bacterium]
MERPQDLVAYREEIRAFVLGELEEAAAEIERNRAVPPDLWNRLAQKGLLRLTLPTRYGGWGLRMMEYLPILEVVAQAHGSVRMVVHVHNGLWRLLDRYGTEEQKHRYLSRWATGEARLAFALTEPDAGTGTDIRTEARRVRGGWVLRGRKWLITFADLAEAFIVVAYTDRSRGAEGISAFLVPRTSPGLRITLQPDGMGLVGTGHGLLEFEDCFVPQEAVLGEEGQGLRMVLRGFLDPSRISIAASCVGLAQRALEVAKAHAQRRVTFGRPLAQRQAIQFALAEMAVDVQAARLLVLDAARKVDAGEPCTTEAAMAKLYGLEMVGRVTDKALRICGGIGYLRGHPIERIYRDARALWFEEGTAEIQKLVIARSLLGSGASEA